MGKNIVEQYRKQNEQHGVYRVGKKPHLHICLIVADRAPHHLLYIILLL